MTYPSLWFRDHSNRYGVGRETENSTFVGLHQELAWELAPYLVQGHSIDNLLVDYVFGFANCI